MRATPAFLTAGLLLLAAQAALADATARRMPRIGHCSEGVPADRLASRPFVRVLVSGLREHQRYEGRNVQLVLRSAVGLQGGMAECVDSLVRLPVDVLLALGDDSTRIAMEKTRTIPIVATFADPVESGFASSLARPDNNVTGVATGSVRALVAKQLALLKEVAKVERIVVLEAVGPSSGEKPGFVEDPGSIDAETLAAAMEARVAIAGLVVTAPEQMGPACAEMARRGRTGLFINDTAALTTWNLTDRRAKTLLAEECTIPHRIPAMGIGADSVHHPGILIGLGAEFVERVKRLPRFIDRILRGASPSSLPIEQMDRHPIGINLEVAREIGLTVPPAILLQAEVVVR